MLLGFLKFVVGFFPYFNFFR